MNKLILFFVYISFHFVYSQESITGKILEAETLKPLAYVNIGIANKAVGTVSDTHGNFKLQLNEKVVSKDTIVFSHIGYAPRFIPISVLSNQNVTVKLEPLETRLQEVVVKYKKPKTKKMGRKSKGFGLMHQNFYSFHEKDVDDRLSKEIGVRVPVKKDCRVQALNFNITTNDFKSLRFRINFYQIKKGLPGELLNTRDIIFEIEDGHLGWFKVDLTSFDILLEKDLKEVVVSIQWLESEKATPKSKYFSISTKVASTKSCFFREKTMDKWRVMKSKPSFYLDAECK
ncbi:carboxypeptidase-like regulatory domain-containing protein [Flagellimonas onchidii]|uniref:carboxypeptidase-like regulatory domain-containing protein n=1 Tax=Flagellimonas onchidii TaxID=2562684 RepID=UPI0010A62A40|nr:carboxypeptidase-like regulatory domain-containing protein [Allomuricauda onchidii]